MSFFLSQFNFQFFAEGSQVRWDADTTFTQAKGKRKWVFLHGLMGYGLNFRRIASSLGPGEIALTFDQRGHGRSFKPQSGYAPADFADDLFKIMTELKWRDIILVGHSMGGRNALAFSLEHSSLLKKLVIVDIGPESKPEAIRYFQSLFDSVPTPFTNKQQAKIFFMNDFPKTQFGQAVENSETLGMYLYSNLVENEGGEADWRFSKDAMMSVVIEGRAKDQWREVQALEVPTLLVRGKNSSDLPPDVYLRTLTANPVIQGIEIANAGHWVHSDQPEEFIRTIKEFANSP